MEQFEKVVKGLECCVLRDPDDNHRCGECPYNHHEMSNAPCANGLKWDALELLKAQEAQSVLSNRICESYPCRYVRKGFCPNCHQEMEWLLNRNYCGFCGQKVKWK